MQLKLLFVLLAAAPGASWLLEPCPEPAAAPNMTFGRLRFSWLANDVVVPPGIALSELQLMLIGCFAAMVLERLGRLLTPRKTSLDVDQVPGLTMELAAAQAQLADAGVREAQLVAQLAEANMGIENLEADVKLHQTDKMARAAIHRMRKDMTRSRRSFSIWAELVVEARAARETLAALAAVAKLADEDRLAKQKRKALDDLATQQMLLSANVSSLAFTKRSSNPNLAMR